MIETADIGGSIGPVTVSDWHFDDFKVQLRSAENKVKISEGIEVTKVVSTGSNPFIICAEEDLGAAQGVFERLVQEPGKCY